MVAKINYQLVRVYGRNVKRDVILKWEEIMLTIRGRPTGAHFMEILRYWKLCMCWLPKSADRLLTRKIEVNLFGLHCGKI